MPWTHLAILSAVLVGFGTGYITLILAARRERLARERGAKHFQGRAEIASQTGFSASLLLLATADISLFTRPIRLPSALVFPLISALISRSRPWHVARRFDQVMGDYIGPCSQARMIKTSF